MCGIDEMYVGDCLAQSYARASPNIADLVVIDRSTNLQARNGDWAHKQPKVKMVAVVLVIGSSSVEIGTNCVARSILRDVVQAHFPGRYFACHGHSHRLSRQRATVVCELHNQRAICRGLKPTATVKSRVVIANSRLIPPERHPQVIVVVVLEQHPLQINAESLSILFSEHDF